MVDTLELVDIESNNVDSLDQVCMYIFCNKYFSCFKEYSNKLS